MIPWVMRYIAFATLLMGLFAGFVACGAQYYKVSLHGDTPDADSSVVEGTTDPSSPNFGLHAPGGWTSTPIRFVTSSELNDDQSNGLRQAIQTWETAVGKKLFDFQGFEKDRTGDSFPDLYSSLDDKINGHYLDHNWTKTGKPRVVLATTIWENDGRHPEKISTADIRYNYQYYLLGDSFSTKADGEREVVDMQTLALHELGHLLGLAHIPDAADGSSIMNPSLYIGEGLANRRLSRGDIARVQKIYGCQGSACDIDATLALLDKIELQQRQKTLKGTTQPKLPHQTTQAESTPP